MANTLTNNRQQEIKLGSVHPQYGGRLVDLMTLPDDYWFDVANGAWRGFITIEGDKHYMNILETERKILITDENRYGLWFEISKKEFQELYPDVQI